MHLLIILAFMFFGSLAAGVLPFLVKAKEHHLNTVASLGGGLLIGTVLAVIVPEGFNAYAEVSGTMATPYGCALVAAQLCLSA